ncbi:MAG: iron ABC transporter permease [Verrucomicrobia bacterium]|nr:iron ABC transporter permease [Verrucomicrobiota bacterium]
MSRSFALFVYALTAAFFGLFFLWPIVNTLGGAFVDVSGHFTWRYVAEIFRNPIYVEGLRNALLLALASTGAAFVLALPLAWLADRFEFPGKKLFGALLLAPMILPPFVGAIGIKKILGQEGALNALFQSIGLLRPEQTVDWLGRHQFWGVVALNALHLYPILYLNVAAALANIDPAMEEAAENLGCTGLRKFWKITLPLIAPGVFAGGTIVFIWAFTELGTPLLLDYTRVTPVQIFYGIKDLGSNPLPYALVAVTLVATALLYFASRLFFGRKVNDLTMMAKATSRGGPRAVSAWAGAGCAAAFAFVIFLALLPHLGVVLVAFSSDWYDTVLPRGWTLENFRVALGHPLTVPSIGNSLKYAALSTVFDAALGVGIAYVVVRTRLAGRQWLDALAMLPLAVPGLVLAFGYLAMTQEGRLFAFLNPVKNALPLLVIAYAVRRLPYMVRSASAGYQQTSVTLEEAAQNLGASPWRATRKITLPLIAANLLAGGLLTFSFAMLEVSDSLLLAQKQEDFPITKAIYELFQLLGTGRAVASALGVWAMVFLGVTILGASLLLGKKMGALFRA